MIKACLFFCVLALLSACSGADDNSEPPAELIEFEATATLEQLWKRSVGDGDEQQFLKLYPLLLEDRIILADRQGKVVHSI